jgi:transposase
VLRALEQTIRQVDDEIHRVIQSDPKLLADVELLCSIPGVAEFGAAVIIAEIGDFSNFRKAKQLVAFFGLEPSVHQSGKYVGKNNQLSKRGSRFMRKMLHLIVQTNIAHLPGKPDVYRNPVISDYYKKKCESKAKLAACCAVMHKLVNIIFAVLRDRKPYEIRTPEEHIKLMQARCVAAVTAA